MIFTFQHRHQQQLLTTISRIDALQYHLQQQVNSLIDLPLSERLRREDYLIEKQVCPNCGSSLNDIVNQLEGEPLRYNCIYCNLKEI